MRQLAIKRFREESLPAYFRCFETPSGFDEARAREAIRTVLSEMVSSNVDADGREFKRPNHWALDYPLQPIFGLIEVLLRPPVAMIIEHAYRQAKKADFRVPVDTSMLDGYLVRRAVR
jgi:hypothetical protein